MSEARSRSAFGDEPVDQTDDRRIVGRVEQIGGGRHVLHQAREIGLAREVVADLRDAAAGGDVVRAGELRREALGVYRARRQRALQHTLQLGQPLDRRVGPRQHDDRVPLLAEREHALRLRE